MVSQVSESRPRPPIKVDPSSNRAHDIEMRKVNSPEVLARLSARASLDRHVDPRLIDAVKAPGNLYLLTLNDAQSFLSLIWQEIDPTRLLTPRGQPRTLLDVAGRMVKNKWTFSSLCRPMGLMPTCHDPAAFESFEKLNTGFDINKFDFIAVTPATDSEKLQSPSGTYYIYDGVHKSLVLAYRILNGQSIYQPVEALLMTPRRD